VSTKRQAVSILGRLVCVALSQKSHGHAVAAGDHQLYDFALMAKTRAVAPTLHVAHLPWIESNSISKISMALGPMAPPAPRDP